MDNMSLQNYYGDAIRRNKGDLEGMMKAVQATLLHCNSTDEVPRHHTYAQRVKHPGANGRWRRLSERSTTTKIQSLRQLYNSSSRSMPIMEAGPFWKSVQVDTPRMSTKVCTLWCGNSVPRICFKDKLVWK